MILPAEFVGWASAAEDGTLRIGEGDEAVNVRLWHGDHFVAVYVRRDSKDLSIVEIAMARHDGLAVEECRAQNMEAARYPAGAKEYWRGIQVGKDRYGPDQHLMTDKEFEQEWAEQEADRSQ